MKQRSNSLFACAAAATLALFASGIMAQAQVHGIGAAKTVIGPNGDDLNPRAHIGDTVTVRVTVFNLDTFNHAHLITNVSDKVFHTSGTTDTGNLLPSFGGSFTLVNFGDSRTFDPLHSYVVAPNDPTNLVDEALAVSTDQGNNLRYTSTPQASLLIVHPAITVTKDCQYIGTPDNPLVRFSGVVSNAGDITLTNVVVVDDAGTPGNPADDTSFFIGTLLVGQSAGFIGTNVAVANPHSNRVVATAIDETGPSSPASFVAATNSCSANIPCNPAIQVTKSCPATPPLYGTLLTYTGTVTNTGNVTLQNVVVVDDKPAPNTVVFTAASLAPGAGATFTASYTVTNCPLATNTLTARGTANAICGSVNVTNKSTAVCSVECLNPIIRVTKNCNLTGTPDNPTVAYSGIVSNAGNATLTNVVVIDDNGTPLNPADDITHPIGTLLPHTTAPYSGTYTAASNPSTNTVVARGTDALARTVTDTAFCSVTIPCNPSIRVTKSCPITAPLYGTTLTYNGTVTNNGNVTLQNVVVVDDKPAPGTVVFTAASLAPGAGASFSGSYTVTDCPLATNTLRATGTANAICGTTSVTNFATAVCSVECLNPIIRVTKNCNLTGTPDNPTVAYSGIVSNAGNATLTNVVVIDDNGTPGNTADDITHPIGTLAPHTSAPYSGTYTATSNPSTNTVVARGTDALAQTVTDTAFCSVTIRCNPAIAVTKACPANTVLVGSTLTITGTVTNTGNVTLTGVTVVNDQPVAGTVLFGPVTLAPGAGATFSGSYTATNCPTSTDTVTASGTANTICGSQVVTSQASASCAVDCTTPNICVVKEIVCSMADGCEATWAKTATGVRRVDESICPTFCYRISVTNCGTAVLTNVTLLDNKVSLSGQTIPSTLAVGEGFTVIVSNVTLCKTTTNTVTATGQSATTGQSTSANDSAIAYVKDAAIDCLKMVVSTDALDRDPADNYLLLPGDDQPHIVTFAVRVSNIGDVDLVNVVVTDPMLELAGCQPPAPFSLAAGASTTIELCAVQLTCANLPLTNVVSITAQVDRGTNNLCVYDAAHGTNVSVNTHCDAIVACEPPGGCRTTGGGRQEKDKTFPRVRYVTHGGQVGASIGIETAFTPDSQCIKGEWEHVRHIQGGLRGNFHARSFDSLMCACLACDGGAGNKVGRLCNPNDRACGPEPRPAGANKLTFSGIGDYTLTNGRRTPRAVLFRVDIEDRSEPGGSHPKGGTPPPDRYRIRIWILNEQELALLRSADRLLAMRSAVAASKTNTPLKDGALKADGVTPVDLGTAVFGVRAPDIDDGGELDRGNRQIHPAIKSVCP